MSIREGVQRRCKACSVLHLHSDLLSENELELCDQMLCAGSKASENSNATGNDSFVLTVHSIPHDVMEFKAPIWHHITCQRIKLGVFRQVTRAILNHVMANFLEKILLLYGLVRKITWGRTAATSEERRGPCFQEEIQEAEESLHGKHNQRIVYISNS